MVFEEFDLLHRDSLRSCEGEMCRIPRKPPCTPNCISRIITLPNKMYCFVQANFPKSSTTTTLWWLLFKKKPDISHLFNPHPPYIFRHKWCAFQNKTVWVWVLQLRILPFKFAIWKAWSYATWRWEQAGKDFSDLCGEHPTTVLILKAVLKWCATWKDICYNWI